MVLLVKPCTQHQALKVKGIYHRGLGAASYEVYGNSGFGFNGNMTALRLAMQSRGLVLCSLAVRRTIYAFAMRV